jgi:hypothetical protein
MTHVCTCAGLVAGLLLPVVAGAQGANAKAAPRSPTADRLPIYEVDPTWPPTLPNDWILGDIRGLFVDDRDHLWVIHMPSSLTPQEIGAAVKHMHWPRHWPRDETHDGDDIHPNNPPAQQPGEDYPGWAYGAFLLNRYTRWDFRTRFLSLYYLLSTSSPYQVHLMHTTIRLAV